MSILARLTTTPLLYALGALLLVTAGQGVWMWKRGVDLHEARVSANGFAKDLATSERHVTEIESARKGWEDTANQATAIIAKMQADATELGKKNAEAIVAAETAQAAAEQRSTIYHGKFTNETRKPDCAHALAALEGACPNLSGY